MSKKKPPSRMATLDELISAGYRLDESMLQATQLPAVAAEASEGTGSMRRLLQDGGISLLKGAIGVPEAAVGLADILTGGQAGKLAESAGFRPREAKEFLDSQYTPETQAAMQKVQAAEGFTGKLAAAIENPSVIGTAVTESVPMMGAGGVVGRGMLAAAPRMGAVMAGAAGEGVVAAGSAAEQIRQQTSDGLLTPRQAALGAATGVGTAALGAVGGKVASKLGIGDVDTMLARGASAADPAQAALLTETKKGIARRFVEGALAEGALEELPQSIQEQVLQNAALNRPWDEGVDMAAAMGLLSGMAMGGPAGALGGNSPKVTAEQLRAEKLADSGPMTRAVNAGIEQTASDVERGATVPGLTEAQENAGLSRMEAVMADDQAAIKQAGRMDKTPPAFTAAHQGGAADPSADSVLTAEAVDSPFADRVLEVRGALQDSTTVAAIRSTFGEEGMTEALRVLGVADNPNVDLPARTRDNMLAVAEAIISRAVLKPVETVTTPSVRNDPQQGPTLPSHPQAPQLELDAAPTGTIRVDGQGNAAPETRADAINTRQAQQEQAAAVGGIEGMARRASAVWADPAPATEKDAAPVPALTYDAAATGRMIAGPAGVRRETRADVINERNRMAVRPGDRTRPNGEPFRNLSAAKAEARRIGGAAMAVAVDGGWVVREGEDGSEAGTFGVAAGGGDVRTDDDQRGVAADGRGAGGAASAVPAGDVAAAAPAAADDAAFGGADAPLTGTPIKTQKLALAEAAKVGGKIKRIPNGWAVIAPAVQPEAQADEQGQETRQGTREPQGTITQQEGAYQAGPVSAGADPALAAAARPATVSADGLTAGPSGQDAAAVDEIRTPKGMPFKSKAPAQRAARMNPGYVVAEVAGGWVARREPAEKVQVAPHAAAKKAGAAQTSETLDLQPTGSVRAGEEPEQARSPGPDSRVPEPPTDADTKPAQAAKPDPEAIQDFGEKLGGARKDAAASLRRELTDDAIATEPFSKVWPATETDSIEDKFAAAVAFAARAEVPAKPRSPHRVARWVENVKRVRGLAQMVVSGESTKETVLAEMGKRRLEGFAAKVALLEAIDRAQWARIGEVAEAPQAYRYDEDGKQIRVSFVRVVVDGKSHFFEGATSVADVVERVEGLLGAEVQAKKMQFEVRGKGASFSINKKGDKEYRKLKTFTTGKEALEFAKTGYEELVAAWENVKARDNVRESDVRGDENRPRTAEDYRGGKDVTAEQFSQAFGFRGVEFGNWVAQGGDAKARQGMLNQAYDALMDLASIVQVPPRAISLNGTLGLAFGARGSGKASAHYEPDTLVMNLTKTRGAGVLAHEWFHALDNYFAHQRGGPKPMAAGMTQQDYRQANYITYRPEPLYVRKAGMANAMTLAQLERNRERNPQSGYFAAENWQLDPAHPAGVRPEVERAFAELVEALDASPMKARAQMNDKAPEGYWSRIIERAARAFENFVIFRMMEKGYHNDYLANVRGVEEFPRSTDRYPYLLAEEIAPITEAFDNLFGTIETREGDDGKVAMFSRSGVSEPDSMSGHPRLSIEQVEEEVAALTSGWANAPKVVVVESLSDPRVPPEVRAEDDAQRSLGAGGEPEGFFFRGAVYITASQMRSRADVRRVLFHEALGHFGLRGLYGKGLAPILDQIVRARPHAVRAKAREYGLDLRNESDRYAAAEEVLAEMAQSRPEMGFVRRTIAAIRSFLRGIGLRNLKLTDDEIIAQFLLPARRFVEHGRQRKSGASRVSFSWGKTPEELALKALSENDDLFALPRSDKDTVEEITAENERKIKVSKNTAIPGQTRYNFTLPSGKTARMMVRNPNPFGGNTYGFNYEDGELSDVLDERPGENPEDVPPTGDVWIDVSLLESGDEGRTIYNIAATYAHNTGRIFIGDPAGLSDDAMRRRPEMMLSSALKFGTTAHLAPHPRQVTGDWRLGIKPLKWVYGDDIGNIERLIDLNVAALQNAGLDAITFDPKSGQFLDSDSQPIDRAGIAKLAESGYGRSALAGSLTLSRGAILHALSSEGRASSDRIGRDGTGILGRLLRQSSVHPQSTRKVFYSRAKPSGATDRADASLAAERSAAFKRWYGDWELKNGNATNGTGEGGNLGRDRGADRTDSGGATLDSGRSGPLDPQGRPERLYHGTADDISAFEIGHRNAKDHGWLGRGIYLTNVADDASTYASIKTGAERPNVMPVYAAIKNPYRATLADKKRIRDGGPAASEAFTSTLRAQGYDGVVLDYGNNEREYVAFEPGQVKSAIGNSGAFDGLNHDIRFSRSKVADALRERVNSARDLALPAGYIADDFITKHGTLGLWQKTVGTPFNLAKKSPAFRRVFEAVQSFLGSVSTYGTEAANLAPDILPKLDKLADIKKSPLSAVDTKALGRAVFEGTLKWSRNEDGAVVPAHESAGFAGVEWTAAELRERFAFNPGQIKLYQQFRAATNESLRSLTASEIVRLAGDDMPEGLKEEAMDMDPTVLANQIAEYLAQRAKEAVDAKRAATLAGSGERVLALAERFQKLKDKGYAPLTRFGTHTLDVVDEGGQRIYFGLFESAWGANRMARMMRRSHPKASIGRGTLSQESYKLFAGVSPETVEIFGELLGLDATGDSEKDAAFQEYIKRAKATRSAMRRMIHRGGIEGFSDDAGRVLAGFIYSNARAVASNLHSAEMTEAALQIPKGQGELQDYAVKLVDYVKNPQEEAQALRGMMFAYFLGGSVASAVVNMTQPFAVTFPYLSQFGGVRKSAAEIAQAFKDVAAGKTGDAALDAALKRAEEDGIVSPQEVFQLMAQARGKGGLNAGDGTLVGDAAAKLSNGLSKLSLGWGKMFGFAELVNRRVTFIAAYRMAPAGADPAKFAADAINETQFVYNKGNRPKWARGTLGATLFTFKQYSVNYVELLARMANSGPEGRKAALLAIAVLALMGGADELPFLKDAEDVVDGLMQRLGYNFSSQNERNKVLADVLGKDLARLAAKGLTGIPGMPIDLSGRLGMGNLLPGTGLFQKKDDYTRDVIEVAGPAAKLAQAAFKTAGAVVEGDPLRAAQEALPVAGQNLVKGSQMLMTGDYRDAKGRKVIDTTTAEGVAKLAGFQPESVARVQEASADAQRMVALVRQQSSEITADWAQAIVDGDRAGVEAARQRLVSWNRKNPEAPIKIDQRGLRKKVIALRQSRAERLAAAAPKQLRAEVKRTLEEAGG